MILERVFVNQTEFPRNYFIIIPQMSQKHSITFSWLNNKNVTETKLNSCTYVSQYNYKLMVDRHEQNRKK